MRFLIKGTDTAGSIAIRRDTADGALKKASELEQGGCWDVAITDPDGRIYISRDFGQLPSDARELPLR
jgi:hypothetical protein